MKIPVSYPGNLWDSWKASLPFLVVLALFSGQLGYRLYFHFSSQSWRPASGVMESVTDNGKGVGLDYRYVFEGQEYRGSRLAYFVGMTSMTIVKVYRTGSPVNVFVDPEKPTRSVLNRDSLTFDKLSSDVTIIGFCLVAVFGTRYIAKKPFRIRVNHGERQG